MAEPSTDAAGEPRVVLVTAPDGDAARALARAVVSERLAACVNLVPGVTSVYRWRGAVEEERETLCVVKTTAARVPALERWLDEHHPYDVPECVALAPASVAAPYLEWLRVESAPAPEP